MNKKRRVKQKKKKNSASASAQHTSTIQQTEGHLAAFLHLSTAI
jgi:hypothetical protein